MPLEQSRLMYSQRMDDHFTSRELQVIKLRYIEELTYPEIAAKLKITQRTAMYHGQAIMYKLNVRPKPGTMQTLYVVKELVKRGILTVELSETEGFILKEGS